MFKQMSMLTVVTLSSVIFAQIAAPQAALDTAVAVIKPAATQAAPDSAAVVVKPAVTQAPVKSAGKIERSLDSAYALLKAQALSDLSEYSTGETLIINLSASVRKILTNVDINTQDYTYPDSLFTLYVKGLSKTFCTKSGPKKIEVISVTSGIIKTPPVKKAPAATTPTATPTAATTATTPAKPAGK